MQFNDLFRKMICTVACPALLLACNSGRTSGTRHNDSSLTTTPKADSIATLNDTAAESQDEATVYLAIADTGKDYAALDKTMYLLHKKLMLAIDTMGRYYNSTKNLIAVSDTDADELYRGEYFPRRFTAENLSLEYYKTYNAHSTEKNIALVSGIYETRERADSALELLKTEAPRAFVIQANVYVGCMH